MSSVESASNKKICWERASKITAQPMRIFHRGSPREQKDDVNPWTIGKKEFAYAADSCVTGVARIIATPVQSARVMAKKHYERGGPLQATLGGVAGFAYGIPKGIVGAGVSVSCATWFVYEGACAEIVGIAFGVATDIGQPAWRGLAAVDRMFTSPSVRTKRTERRKTGRKAVAPCPPAHDTKATSDTPGLAQRPGSQTASPARTSRRPR